MTIVRQRAEGRAVNFEIIKRTPLPNDDDVMTARRTNPYLIRPFATFTITPRSRYVSRLADFATEAAALHAHEKLVRNGQRSREDHANQT